MPSRLFDRIVEQYDAWYDAPEGRALYRAELETLRPLVETSPAPALEVGVGTGRFAGELGIQYGVDLAVEPLRVAQTRGVHCAAAVGEALPFASGTFGSVVFVFTLCFVDDPAAVLREATRVLKPNGMLVLGVVPGEGPLGRHYQQLGSEGHLIYREAGFISRDGLYSLVREAGLRVQRVRTTPMRVRKGRIEPGEAQDGDTDDAGFLVLSAVE